MAALIGTGVFLALASMYAATQRAFDYSTSQAYLQRQATLIQERIALLALNATSVQAVSCGPNTTAGRSLMFQQPDGTVRCIWQTPGAPDADADLMLCTVSAFAAGSPCQAGTTENLLTLMRSEVGPRLGAALRVRNTTFTQITCVDPGGSCGFNATGRSVSRPVVDVRFDLTEGTIVSPRPADYVGMRFAFSLAARN
jgi:hypothetical protein